MNATSLDPFVPGQWNNAITDERPRSASAAKRETESKIKLKHDGKSFNRGRGCFQGLKKYVPPTVNFFDASGKVFS